MSMDLRGFFRKEMAPVDDNAVPVRVVVLCRPKIQSLADKYSFSYLKVVPNAKNDPVQECI
jgi:hypothetical protein